MAVKKPQLPKGLLEFSEDEIVSKIIEWTQLDAKGMQAFIHDLLQTVNIPVVTAAPTEDPDHPPIMKLMDDGGGNRRLYVYYEEAWSYIELVGGGGAPTGDSFGVVAVAGQDDVESDIVHDTLTLIEGSDITITTDAVNDTVTIGIDAAGPYDHSHTNDHSHANKAELDKVTDGDHDVVAAGNPHSVTAAEVGAYTTAEVDALTWVEADITDLDKYTQAEVDALTWVEADITDLDKYTQAEVDALTWVEADITDLDKYTQAEVDDALALKLALSGGTMSGSLTVQNNMNVSDGGYLLVEGQEGGHAIMYLHADQGDDNADKWNIQAHTNGSLEFRSYASGGWANVLLLGPDSATGTVIKDEDDMASDSAVHLATQQSIKKYVDDSVDGAIHDDVAGEINAIAEKGSPVASDVIVIEDSADSYNKKMVQLDNLPGGAGGGGDLKADGTVPLTANWDCGAFEVRAETLEADVATGTSPLTVASTTKVTNLNADLLDGYHLSTTRNSANTVPVRDASGYTQLGWINTTSGSFAGTPSRIYASNDAYIRYMTYANFNKYTAFTVSGWLNYNQKTPAINDSFNVTSVTDHSAGNFTVVWATNFANNDYAVVHGAYMLNYLIWPFRHLTTPLAVGSTRLLTYYTGGAYVDCDEVSVIAIGDQ